MADGRSLFFHSTQGCLQWRGMRFSCSCSARAGTFALPARRLELLPTWRRGRQGLLARIVELPD